MIRITCDCGKQLKVKPDFAGRKVRCPSCSSVLLVPNADSETDSSPSLADKTGTALKEAGSALVGAGSAVAGFFQRKPQSTSETTSLSTRRTVFEHLTAQKQDASIVEKVMERVSALLTNDEQVQYIAIQQRPLINWFPDCVVLTNRRVILYHPKLLGRVDFVDYIWRRLRNARLQENMIGSTLTFETTDQQTITLDYLPKEQARQLYRFAQEREEEATEERRLRRMEEDRARAGGVQIMQQIGTTPGTPTPSSIDPVAKLQQLKQLLEAGLISQPEYDAKRAETLKAL